MFEGDLDDVVGVLHVRDLFAALHDRGIERVDVRSLLRPAIVVPETKRLDELLAEFRRTSNHMAIVVDEYGSVAGLATLEDLLEEIVGEIGDEFDLPDAGIRRLGKRPHAAGRLVPDRGVQRAVRHARCPTRTTTASAASCSASWAGRRRWGTRVDADGARFEVSGVDGPRIVRGGRHARGRPGRSRPSGPVRRSGECQAARRGRRAARHGRRPLGDAAHAVVDPAELDRAPADQHVGMMVGLLGRIGDAVRKRHRGGEVGERGDSLRSAPSRTAQPSAQRRD